MITLFNIDLIRQRPYVQTTQLMHQENRNLEQTEYPLLHHQHYFRIFQVNNHHTSQTMFDHHKHFMNKKILHSTNNLILFLLPSVNCMAARPHLDKLQTKQNTALSIAPGRIKSTLIQHFMRKFRYFLVITHLNIRDT